MILVIRAFVVFDYKLFVIFGMEVKSGRMLGMPLVNDMAARSEKNPKGAGRKNKFTTEELLNIFDSFLIHEYKGHIDCSKLTEHAIKKLGYAEGEIRYDHFSKNSELKKRIEDVRKERKRKFASEALLSFQNIDIDAFVDKYFDSGNKREFKGRLRDVQLGQMEMYKNMVNFEAENRELKSKLKNYENNSDESEKHIRELKGTNVELSEKVDMLKKLVNVDNHKEMLQYVWDKTSIEAKHLVEQYMRILNKCGVINEKDTEEIKKHNTDKNELRKEETSKVIKMFREKADENTVEKNISPGNELELEDISVDDIDELLKDD